MPADTVPGHRPERRRPRSVLAGPATVLLAVTALIGAGTMAGPMYGASADEPCSLPRSGVHHSLGLDSWNSSYPRPDGDLDAVMLFLSFPDAEPYLTPAAIAAEHFPATSDFFSRSSYGQFRLTAHVVEEWIEMPQASTAYGIQRDWDAELRSAYLRDALELLEPRVDFAGHDIIYLVADPDAPGVDSDATKVVNFDRPVEVGDAEIRRIVTVFEERTPDRNVLAHETGHVFDLPDLYRRPDDRHGDWDTYVGDWDIMGSQFALAPDFFGWHKWKLGWLNTEFIDCVRGPGVTRHTLEPLGAPLDPERPENDTRLAVIRTGAHEALVAEARTRAGNDADACTSGVLLYLVRSDVPSAQGPIEVLDGSPDSGACHGRSVHPRLADAPLDTGETYRHTGAGVRVDVGDRTATGGWEVTITKD
ncbi:M6 family metalloprotease domain-containing protein [Streptomyces sp. ACA25]|uniref:M6 family metalloprotease domain-containing protein n=1 Tax=Streptomyces sp. ACA25 TaxID=3022596 RepID=UPI002307AAE9|nr:M6 family metalloprotease domain-containing protein [Streptomyces sp. ACA25]MDB1089592.1 M6 family metalloprotease domain-containing protein [Streptomyces sp. ACA25]